MTAAEPSGAGAHGTDAAAAAEFRALLGPARLAYFSQLTDQPILADRKATFILTASGLIVTVLLFFLEPLAAIIHGPSLLRTSVLLLLLLVLSSFLLVAVRSAYRAYVTLLPPMPPSLAFFRDIAGRPLEQYVRGMGALTHRDAVDAMLHYNYTIATTAAVKFRLVGRALRCMRVAIPLWMLILLLLTVWR